MTKTEAQSDKWARMQWWCSWHSPEARNFRRAPLPATVWQREVERIGPAAMPIPQHLCEELFPSIPRRTICSCLLDHAGSSATFQQINLCIFWNKRKELMRVGKCCEKQEVWQFSRYPLCHPRTRRTICSLKIRMMAAAVLLKLTSWQVWGSPLITSVTLGGISRYSHCVEEEIKVQGRNMTSSSSNI